MIWYVLPCTMSWRPQNKAAIETHVLVRTNTYWYVLVCTGMYWYVLVHTSMYRYILVHTIMYEFHQRSDLYMPVRTRTYGYIRVHAVPYPFKKKCKQVSNPQSCAYLAQSLPRRYGATDLNAGEN